MKASPRQQGLLLELQDLDTSIARLSRRRDRLPEREELSSLTGATAEARDRYMSAQRELDTLRADIQRIEDDVSVVQQRRDRDEQLLAASTSSKEAQALQNELDALGRRRSELEDRELVVMEQQEAADAVFAEASAGLAEIDARRASLEASITEAEQRLDGEIAAAAEERAGLAAEVQRDLLDHYEEIRSRIGIGAARLRGNVSEASNMALAPAELADILDTDPDELVYCPGTGAILVRIPADDETVAVG